MPKTWIEEIEDLSPAVLTVRAQAQSVTDQGRLYWNGFMPRRDVNSTTLDDVTTLDFRPVADRREWNQRGRLLPKRIPPRRQIKIVPIEMYDLIGEEEMQKLMMRFNGDQALVAGEMAVDIPSRVDQMALGDYRRLELDMFEAWLNGSITQRHPQTGETFAASFGIDSSRITTALTAWDDAGVNAYDELVAWYEDGLEAVGAGRGVALRLATLRAIQADAPDLANGVQMTRAQLAERVQDDLGAPFEFIVIEDTVDLPTDGGTATSSTKVFEAGNVAFVPADNRIGSSAFVPVLRAYDLVRQFPQAGIDTRGVTVFYDEEITGRELRIEAQLNAMPIPDEQRVWVIDAGV
ncbi:MAG TPA: major capsid protein [Pyrinomonadaceae bacterium]|nr:major capsid protein [Pyrinomonadaceae bacterium]